jgi:hypothetical protein
MFMDSLKDVTVFPIFKYENHCLFMLKLRGPVTLMFDYRVHSSIGNCCSIGPDERE